MPSDRILIFAIGPDVYEIPEAVALQYRRTGTSTMSNPATAAPEPPQQPELVDCKQLAATLNVPASWIMERARSGLLQCIMVGRYRRFEIAAVRAALAATGCQPVGHAQVPDSKGRKSARYRGATTKAAGIPASGNRPEVTR